jgi:hypothetical protein
LDLVFWLWLVRRGSWCDSDFLRQTSTLSAATIHYIWQPGFAAKQTLVLSLGIPVHYICSRFASVLILIKTVKVVG